MRLHSQTRFLAVDSLRGAAALTVAIYHFSPSWAGYLAVDFFFVLSGFVLSHTYLYRKTPITLREFTIRRLARLYPLQIFTLLMFILVWITIQGQIPVQPDGTLFTFFQQLTLTHNVGLNPSGLSWNYPGWSISVEFWVNIAFILFVFRTTRSSGIFLVATSGLMVIYWNTGHLETQAANYFGFLNYLSSMNYPYEEIRGESVFDGFRIEVTPWNKSIKPRIFYCSRFTQTFPNPFDWYGDD